MSAKQLEFNESINQRRNAIGLDEKERAELDPAAAALCASTNIPYQEAYKTVLAAAWAAKSQAYFKKETPEEYKARKELQAQRAVKKETPEEYKSRIEYMKKKENLELEAETYRLFHKLENERKRDEYNDYKQQQRDERSAARAEAYEANQAYKNSAEGRAEQEKKDEKTRIWNSPEEKYRREQNTEKFVLNQREKERNFWEKHKNNWGTMACDSAHRTLASGGIDAKFYRGGLHNTLFKYPKK
jgi:hypothetical protein